MSGRRRLALFPVALWIALNCSMFGQPGLIAADPADPGPILPESPSVPSIPWTQLGRSDRLEIRGADESVDTDIPVPPGVLPGFITGDIGSVVNSVDGRVDVLDGRGVVLGSIPAPADLASAPFAVDIGKAQVIAGVARLSFVLRDRTPVADSCTRPPSLTLGRLGSTYIGQTPYPVTVADFLPGYVQQILIRVGPTPTTAQQQAALELVARLTRHYRPIPVRVDLDASREPLSPGPPTRRVIALRDDAEAGMVVQHPGAPDAVLMISGRGNELSQQVQLFADRRVELAQTPSAAVKSATTDAPKATTINTFAQLGVTGAVSVLGSATLYTGFDAGAFAVGPIQQATVHLLAHYTPITAGEASVLVRSGDTVLGVRRLDDSGLLDIRGTIPPESIQSTIGMAIELRYLPSQRCAPLNDRLQFTLDPTSTVAVTPGTLNRGGFPILPMALTPEFDVSVDRPEHLRYAAQAINLLGQRTAESLRPRVTSLPEVARSGLGALIIAPGEDLAAAGLKPPMLSRGVGSLDIDGVPATDVDLNGPVGVIQAFSNQGRTVLAIGASLDWSLVDRCFDYIREQPSGWGSLTGDVVATGAEGISVNLAIREGGALIDEYPGDPWKWWAWTTLTVFAVSVLGAAWILLGRRKARLHRSER